MKQSFFLLFLLLTSSAVLAQIEFEPGYFITNENQTVTCLIENNDWKDNPSKFNYRLSEGAEVQTGDIETVREFGVGSHLRYQRFTVDIDRSPDKASFIKYMSRKRTPDFAEETLFLKVVVEGQATLYSYEDANLRRFFYRTKENPLQQLIYKRYQVRETALATNNRYILQLTQSFQCGDVPDDLDRMTYTEKALKKTFIQYNECVGSSYTDYVVKKPATRLFRLTVRPGINNSSLAINSTNNDSRDVDFGSESSFRMGVEAEFVLPFKKNKWSLIVEPTYQKFAATTSIPSSTFSGTRTVTAEYTSWQLPLGVRHYFFLNQSSKLFINALFMMDFPSESSFVKYQNANKLELWQSNALLLGAGYNYRNRVSLEARYATGRNVVPSHTYWTSWYQTFSVIMGITLVK